MEIWKPIKGYEGIYEISNLGRVKSLKRKWSKEIILKPSKNNKGYCMVELNYKHTRKHCLIHRLVAQSFIDNPGNLPQVNHIDGNKSNNTVSNLEWCTQSQNNLHAYKIGLKRITDKHRLASKKNIQIARKHNRKISDT